MLQELRLKNFRCFGDYTINFDKFNIIVGRNNSGKSTIIDALKLISNVIRYAPYRDQFLKDQDIPFSLANLRHNYNKDETRIFSKFTDGTEIEVLFPFEGKPYANLLKRGEILTNKNLRTKILGIVPPVGTFEEEEKIGGHEYIQSIIISPRMARHFRHIWLSFPEGFEEFRELIETTWPGYTIDAPEYYQNEDFEYVIEMYFREDNEHREIFWAGHGFQIWLQLMTFLVKLGHRETLILDEPDIYLHQDMQKKLVNICKERSNQIIIATHAVDIIEEVDPEDILSIDNSTSKAKRLSSIDDVQKCVTHLGSAQNLKLINFIKKKTCLFIEGKDINILKKIAFKFSLSKFVNEDGFAHIELAGFSNWDRLINIDWIFTNVLGEKVKCYVFLDRDYYAQNEIDYVKSTLAGKNVKVHIWEKKEIENYLINFDSIYKLFTIKFYERYGDTKQPIDKNQFDNKLESIMDELKEEVQSQLMSRKVKNKPDKKIDDATVICEFLKEFNIAWNDINYRKKVIPGKDFFSSMNQWLSNEFKISLSISYILNSLSKEEIDQEILQAILDFIELSES